MIDAIKRAFEDDGDILKFADPNEKYADIEALCKRIEEKLLEHLRIAPCVFVRVFREGNLAGYFFYKQETKTLISFGINKKYRGDGSFFKEIKAHLGNDFDCYVFTRNTRALKWLQKNGMKVLFQSDMITFLELSPSL